MYDCFQNPASGAVTLIQNQLEKIAFINNSAYLSPALTHECNIHPYVSGIRISRITVKPLTLHLIAVEVLLAKWWISVIGS